MIPIITLKNIIIASDGVVSIHPYFIHISYKIVTICCACVRAYDLIWWLWWVLLFCFVFASPKCFSFSTILCVFFFCILLYVIHNRILLLLLFVKCAILSLRSLCGCRCCCVYAWFLLHEWNSAFHFFSCFECKRLVLSLPTQSSFVAYEWKPTWNVRNIYWIRFVRFFHVLHSLMLRWRFRSTFTK